MTEREAIVFVPGMNSTEAGAARRRLVNGIGNAVESFEVTVVGDQVLAGQQAVRLRIQEGDRVREVDLFEAFWGDLRVHWGHKESLKRIAGGFGLLLFWFFSPVWKVATRSTYLFVGLVGSSVILLAWYYGLLTLGLTAIGAPDSGGDPEGFQKWCADLGAVMGGWWVWAGVSALLAVFPVQQIVDVAAFAKLYLAEEILEEEEIPHRHKLRRRVGDAILAVCKHPDYQRVTVVAHSFGSVIATDVLADLNSERQVRFVTWGTPLRILQARSAWLRAEVSRCLTAAPIAEWQDYHSKQDWLCGDIPHPKEGRPIQSHDVSTDASFGSKMRGDSHLMYYTNREVLEAALS